MLLTYDKGHSQALGVRGMKFYTDWVYAFRGAL